MRNFYTVQIFNLHHPSVRAMLSKMGVLAFTEEMVELKVKSKHYLSFYEASVHTQADFDLKLPFLYPGSSEDEEHPIRVTTVMNPTFVTPSSKDLEAGGRWDDDCCATVFFSESSEDDDEEEGLPNNWLLKYEIRFINDGIELFAKNGEEAFAAVDVPLNDFTSAYH